jgi:hypothetical protein
MLLRWEEFLVKGVSVSSLQVVVRRNNDEWLEGKGDLDAFFLSESAGLAKR